MKKIFIFVFLLSLKLTAQNATPIPFGSYNSLPGGQTQTGILGYELSTTSFTIPVSMTVVKQSIGINTGVPGSHVQQGIRNADGLVGTDGINMPKSLVCHGGSIATSSSGFADDTGGCAGTVLLPGTYYPTYEVDDNTLGIAQCCLNANNLTRYFQTPVTYGTWNANMSGLVVETTFGTYVQTVWLEPVSPYAVMGWTGPMDQFSTGGNIAYTIGFQYTGLIPTKATLNYVCTYTLNWLGISGGNWNGGVWASNTTLVGGVGSDGAFQAGNLVGGGTSTPFMAQGYQCIPVSGTTSAPGYFWVGALPDTANTGSSFQSIGNCVAGPSGQVAGYGFDSATYSSLTLVNEPSANFQFNGADCLANLAIYTPINNPITQIGAFAVGP